VKKLVASCDLLLVIGSKASSNSNRLREIADKKGIQAHLIDGPKYIQDTWLENKTRIGVTAGASAPEVLVQRVIQHLKEKEKAVVTEDLGKTENVVFPLPTIFRES
jgi:4-hydroxy-3-methylbut-2-enyl diphosphate reductase